MTAYVTVTELRTNLPQVATGTTNDALLQTVLDEATMAVEGVLGFSFGAYAAASARDVRCRATSEYLTLPAYQAGSVTAVYEVSCKGTSSETTEAITDYEMLSNHDPDDDPRLYYSTGWRGGTWYRVTATWGYGPPPDDVKRVVKELAFTLWQARQSGNFTGIVGVDGGGGIAYARALTAQQRMLIENARTRALGVVHA